MSDLLQELHEQRLTSGYFGCCGMSRIRGHADLCPTAIAMARDSAANRDLPVPKDCQARAERHRP